MANCGCGCGTRIIQIGDVAGCCPADGGINTQPPATNDPAPADPSANPLVGTDGSGNVVWVAYWLGDRWAVCECGDMSDEGFTVDESGCTTSTCYINFEVPTAIRLDLSADLDPVQVSSASGQDFPNVGGTGIDLNLQLIGSGQITAPGNFLRADILAGETHTLAARFDEAVCMGFSMSANNDNISADSIVTPSPEYWSLRPDIPGSESIVTGSGTNNVNIVNDPAGALPTWNAVGYTESDQFQITMTNGDTTDRRWNMSIYLLTNCETEHYHECDGTVTRLEDDTTGHTVGEWLIVPCSDINAG